MDISYAFRSIRRNPAFAVTAILTLAIGIAGSTTMFTVIYSVLLKPLGYHDPDRLVRMPGGATLIRYQELKASVRSYTEIGAYLNVFGNISLAGQDGPEMVRQGRVSANFFRILGIEPVFGRGFQAEEEVITGSTVAIISGELWRRRFNADPALVGKTITLDTVPHTVVGVMPSGFGFPVPGVDVWLTPPIVSSGVLPPAALLNSPVLSVFGRLLPQAGLEQASAELSVFNQQYATAHAGMLDAKPNTPGTVVPLKDQLVANVRTMLWMLFGAAALVLMIGCANVAGLMLARAASRSREFAVRASLGASRIRIIRQLLVESLVLATIAGGLGVLLAKWSLNAVTAMTSFTLPRAGEIRLDLIVIAFATLISVATGILFGLTPALSISRSDLTEMLRTRDASVSIRWFSTRGLLVVGQVALSVILLIGATLLMESIGRLHRVDPGFNPENVLTMQIGLPATRYDTDQKRQSFFDELIQRVRSIPSVQSAAVSSTLPMTPWIGRPFQVSGREPLKLNERPIAIQQIITPEYFRTLEIPVRRGREFTARDGVNTPLVVMINESAARLFWPEYPNGQDPIGQRLLLGVDPRPYEIVGIVADARLQALENEVQPGIYILYGQVPSVGTVAFTLRTKDNPTSLIASVREAVRAIDPGQAITAVRPMEDVIDATFGQRRLIMTLLQLFAAVAVVLAVVGIYGMIAYSVVQRRREVGLRMALGAHRRDILRLLLQRGFGITALGIVLGLAGALGLTRVLQAFLFQISPTDPITYAFIAVVFVIVGVGASYVPVRRATRIDPMSVLRHN
jgi:putative ABC transport system permease protein